LFVVVVTVSIQSSVEKAEEDFVFSAFQNSGDREPHWKLVVMDVIHGHLKTMREY